MGDQKLSDRGGASRYVSGIDGLRCFAAFSVIAFHIVSQFGPSKNLVAYVGAVVHPSVLLFFVISGFLVYRPVAARALGGRAARSAPKVPYGHYLLRRVLRIFPLYWTVLAVAVITRGGGGLHGVVDWAQAIFLLPLPDVTRLFSGPLGIAMWTLAIEFLFYVLVPGYVVVLDRIRERWLALAPLHLELGGALVTSAALFGAGVAFDSAGYYSAVALPVGMALAVIEARQNIVRRRFRMVKVLADQWWVALVAYLALLVLDANVTLQAFDRPGVVDPFNAALLTLTPIQVAQALLLFVPIAFGTRRSLFVRTFGHRWVQRLSLLTFGFYLWQVPLMQFTMQWFGPGLLGFPFLGTTGFGAPTVLLSLLLAAVSYVAVEVPAARLRVHVDHRLRSTAAMGGPAGSRRSPGQRRRADDAHRARPTTTDAP